MDKKQIRILLVEDDEDMCEELAAILRGENYFIDIAYNGSQGIHFIEKDGYDIILLDLKMPGMGGCAVIEYLKKKHPGIKILVLTGSPVIGKTLWREQEGFPYGDESRNTLLKFADGIINKPFDTERLLSKIKILTNKK